MAYAIGVLLFAVGIAVSIALHEAGHMVAARSFGMRVRRYFIGFGPTLWSKKKGHTEYGFKAVPFGGFCDIAGMTALDPYTEDEKPYLMVDRPGWQRILVMLAGIAVNIVLAMAIIFGVAVTWGLPQTSTDPAPAVVAETMCTPTTIDDAKADDGHGRCEGAGPAADSGLKTGDEVTSVNGVDVDDFPAMVDELDTVGSDAADAGAVAGDRVTVPATVDRNGQEVSLDLQVEVVERQTQSGDAVLTGAIGMRIDNPNAELVGYNALSAIPGSVHYSGYILTETAKALVDLPSRYWPVVESIFGADRADDSPVSVVGASRAGGELVQHDQWMAFLLLLANLNFFLAAFNLVPLPPMDGGHAIVVVYEKIRDWFRRRRGLAPGGPADYTRLLPVTYAVAAILLVFGLTVIVADVINPVQLF
ncbi:M50 family metallopeptidase [Corynebacterium variabile]|uniref:Zinc metalloprotease Rip1 n=1 Tax=Corynebacterium variabile TaxID=1727 RepID=A0A4Y4C436_9CORY|nr:site-2 protease family protein [Corynebacterium variabile]GEC86569.1 Zn-dependent protease [Corynebacterium variabile]